MSISQLEQNQNKQFSKCYKSMEKYIYDMIVIGGGPGGFTTALYAARTGFDVVILEKFAAGGQMALAHQIDNYPGFEYGTDGIALAENMQKQAEGFGAKTEYVEVIRMDLTPDIKMVETTQDMFFGRTVVIATGAGPRRLGLENETMLVGRGISYCAACDGMFYKGKTVVVVGGGNTAVTEALILSKIAKKVLLVHRRDFLRATGIYCEGLKKEKNIEICWNYTVEELLYTDKITGVRLKNRITGEERVIVCDGVFVGIGRTPATHLVQGQLELDESGYIVAGETTKTNIAGVYAVGDVRTKPVRQIVTAVADGSVAVHMAEEYYWEKFVKKGKMVPILKKC